MLQTLTTVNLGLLSLGTAVASVLAVVRLLRPGSESRPALGRAVTGLTIVLALGAGLTFLGRWSLGNQPWEPIAAHVDGLLLIIALLAGMTAYLQLRARLIGLSAFLLPLLTGLLAWGLCASAWTYRPFDLESLAPVWLSLHRLAVYLGTAAATVAAGAGGLYLFVQRRLKSHTDLKLLRQFASLETIEGVVVRAVSLGFALLTVGLLTGLVLVLEDPRHPLGAQWYVSPKFLLASFAWGAYAVLMNAHHAATFRGARAAWLAIAGLLLLVAVYGVVTAWPPPEREATGQLHSPPSLGLGSERMTPESGCPPHATWANFRKAHAKPQRAPSPASGFAPWREIPTAVTATCLPSTEGRA